VNYSNNSTRAKGTGWDAIQQQIAKLEKRHAYHIAQYGEVRAVSGLWAFLLRGGFPLGHC
jgi:hypothetical protein